MTRLRLRWTAAVKATPEERITTTATLEKIAGTLLGGAGTSSPDQDDAFDGGDMSLFGGWDGPGWDTTGWAA